MEKRNRKGEYVVGGQRCGKSTYSNNKAKIYMNSGGSVLVYNLGMQSDFASCEVGKLLDDMEHIEEIKKRGGNVKDWKQSGKPFLYMQDSKGNIFHIKEFNKFFYKKGLKVHRVERSLEDRFFFAYNKYIANTLLIFDDAKGIFSSNLRQWQYVLISAMNHTGKEHTSEIYRKFCGSDIIIIFHTIDNISSQLIDLYNDDYTFTCFYMKELPDFQRITNYELREFLIKSFDVLKTLPKYSYTAFQNGYYKKFTFIN